MKLSPEQRLNRTAVNEAVRWPILMHNDDAAAVRQRIGHEA
jgi:hypothetical protein